MSEKNYKYLLKVAIDFGSTNTVMAWRVYDIGENGALTISEKLNPINPIKRIPSIMIFREDNPGNEMVSRDMYGNDAEAVIRDSNTPPVVCDNFKQYLYTSSPDSEAYQKGISLCTRFFGFLREEYRQEIYNKFSGQVLQELKVILYLSTPVRAHPTHRTLIKTMAAEAGFTPENGITEVSTEYDEARCIVRHAMDTRKDDMKSVLQKASTPGGALLLFVDVGGSTTDINLQKLLIDHDGNQVMDSISSWPNADVTYPLGGCQIDLAIRDYMIARGYANREFTLEKWDHGDGKFRFRRFKEDNNQRLEKGLQIDNLGMVRTVCYDYDEDIVPKVNYKNAPKIDRSIFEQEICGEYIDHLSSAMQELFRNQRAQEGLPPVSPGDVDAIFLAGDGSRLYFIQEELTGHLGKDPGFTKVAAQPNLLFSKWDNPSHCCALGALAELEKMVSYNYCMDQYFIQVRIYCHGNTLMHEVRKNPNLLNPETTSYPVECNGKVRNEEAICLKDATFKLFEKNVQIPAEVFLTEKMDYEDKGHFAITFQMTLFRMNASGEQERIAPTYAMTDERTWKAIFRDLFRGYQKSEIVLNLKCTLTEEKQFVTQFDVKSNSFRTMQQSYQIDM